VFEWDMTKGEWEDYVKDNESYSSKNLSKSADVYGELRFGKLCIDFQHTLDETDWYPFINVFRIDEDGGYGYINGRPYNLVATIGVTSALIDSTSFEDFKKAVEDYIWKLYPDERDNTTEARESWRENNGAE